MREREGRVVVRESDRGSDRERVMRKRERQGR